MASENETFDEVLRCMQNDIVHFVGKPVKHSRDLLQEYHDRFKAAHRREVDVVLKDRDEMFKSEQDTVAKTKEWFDEYQKLKLEVAELKSKMNDVVCENEALRDACGTCGAKREVDELRECLKDAVLYNCAICDSKGKSCEVKGFCLEQRWRKVLETTKGAEDEGK